MTIEEEIQKVAKDLLECPNRVPNPSTALEVWLVNTILNLRAASLISDINWTLLKEKIASSQLSYDKEQYEISISKLLAELKAALEEKKNLSLNNVSRKAIILPTVSQ